MSMEINTHREGDGWRWNVLAGRHIRLTGLAHTREMAHRIAVIHLQAAVAEEQTTKRRGR
jgi:hypothetical protein